MKKRDYSLLAFLTALTLIFTSLKLSHIIDWSWIIIISPMILYLIIVLVLILVGISVTSIKKFK